METYNKSILQYHDVRLAMDCARDEGREEGRSKGLEEGLNKGRKEGLSEGREEEKIAIIQKCLQKNMTIEDIIFFTGYSEEQIIHYKMGNTTTV